MSELEEKNQTLENAATSVKFRESNFQQEIGLLRTSNEWFEAELKTRATDNTKFRKEKNTQIAELQRANADANQTIDSLRSKESSQSKRIEELEQRVEQSLLRVQQLQEEATKHQEQFRAELDNTRRLATLHQENANTVRKRVQELQEQLESTSDQAADEVGRLQAEVDSERIKAAEYENRVAELETMLESQDTQLSELRSSAYVPGTPRRTMNGAFDTPGRAGSPMAFSPGGSRLKGGLSMTQLYTENTKLKGEIRAFQEREEKRSATMSEMLEELESRQPEIEELRQENEHLATEISGMSGLLEEALREKDAARKETRKSQGDYQGLVRQRDLDRQLIRDTTFQNKLLLYQQKSQEEGLESLSDEEQKYLQDTANNEIPDRLLDEDDTATSRLLSKHLVLFRDVSQLVEKNQELLRTIREVADQYEGSEAQAKSAEQEKNSEELSQLRDKLTQYEDEIKSLNLRSQGFMKERDMYRRIITSRGQDASSVLGQSTATPPPGDDAMVLDQTPRSMNSQAINQLQSNLDALKEESATDRATYKHQIDELAKENRQLQSDNVRLSTRQEMTQQRYDVQQHSISTLESEKTRLQKRYNDLHDELAKFELTKQQHTEDLVEARSHIESLSRENMNLKASQTLWKTIEARLTEDKNTLTEDKARLNKIITDMQTLRNEHDLNEAQNRRNLQSRIDSLEAEVQNAKRKLDEETEDHKRASLKQEWEQSEKQKKIDDLLKASNEIRQELASVKSARDQLQSRVNELQMELRHAEERAQSLQARHTPHVNGSGEVDDDGSSREEQLREQISELQHTHGRLQEELESVKSNVEVYKNIAEEAEAQLQSNLETQEHLQEETEKKDAKIIDLQQRVDEISSELATTNTELSTLRGAHEQENLQLTQQKNLFEAEIERLKEEMNDYKAEVENQKQLVASQAEIATTAQHNYETELAKHGETMKNLRALRDEHNKLRTEVAQYKAQAEAATTSLTQSEEHWTSARERYELELTEARTRYSDLEERNKTLYQQLDGVNAQISSLRNNQATVAAGQTDSVNLESGLQALNKTLRDDKDILQVQINAKDLELQRVRQELTHKQEQLDQANEKLVTEQSNAQSRNSGTNLQALQESIEQLNLYRESNTTLRNLNRQLEAERDEKSKEVEILNDQIQPLQIRVADLEGEIEINSGHYKSLEEDRDRWQKRHQDVLHRYDRIDPKELDDLKKQIEDLQTERDQASQQVDSLDERIQAVRDEESAKLEAAKAEWADRRQKIVNQAKEKARTDRERIGELTTERDQIKDERDQLKKDIEMVQSELETTAKARDEAFANVNNNADTNMDEEGQVNENETGFTAEEKADLEARVAAAEDRERQQSNQTVSLGIALEGLKERERTLEKQIVSHFCDTIATSSLTNMQGELQERIRVLNDEVSEAQNQKQLAEAQVQQLQSQPSSNQSTTTAQPSEEIEKLKQELAAAQKEREDLQTRVDMADSSPSNNTEDSAKLIEEQVAQQIAPVKAALAESETNLVNAQTELEELKEQAKATDDAVSPQVNQKMQNLKNKCQEIVNKKKVEIEKLEKEVKDLKEQLEKVQSTSVDTNAQVSTTLTSVKSEQIPSTTATERETQDWIRDNPVAQSILRRMILKKLQEERAKQETNVAPTADEPAVATGVDQEKVIAQKVEDAITALKVDHEKAMAEKVERQKQEVEKKFAAKVSMQGNRLNKVNAQWAVVETAAKEEPSKPVKEVWEVAKIAKPVAPAAGTPAKAQPPVQAPAPAVQSAQPQPSSAPTVTSTPNAPPQQTAPQTATQPNGTKANAFSQQANPFAQSQGTAFQHPMQNQMQNPMQNQMGASFGYNSGGLPQPGFAATQVQQTPFFQNQQGRPNSPFNQMQQPQQSQQPGRGRGDFGTGPAALRNITGQQQGGQSSIPRGGATGIPQPGGRGRGGQPQQMQGLNTNVQGAGQSQIGRGGGRGGGRGRGGAPGSPGMNPGAQHFQPVGAGRGQKRGAEDDGGGAQRGGKRPRGGRGGAAGGSGGAGGEE